MKASPEAGILMTPPQSENIKILLNSFLIPVINLTLKHVHMHIIKLLCQ